MRAITRAVGKMPGGASYSNDLSVENAYERGADR